MTDLPDELRAIARRQHDVVSRSQARKHLSVDAIRWRLTTGRWQRIIPGVYAIHAGPVTWEMRVQAALLHCGDGAALAMETAGHVDGFIARRPQVITVAVPHSRRVRKVPGIKVVRRRELRTTTRKGFTVTTEVSTVLECADNPLFSERDVVCLIADAVHARAVSEADLATGLAARSRHQQREVIRLAIGDVAEGAESGLEIIALRDVIRAHGLPEMRMQQPAEGGRLQRDFENEEYRVVLELDGKVGHEAGDRIKDLRRDRRASSTGRVTLRAGWVDAAYEACELAMDLFGTYRGRVAIEGPCSRAAPRASRGVARPRAEVHWGSSVGWGHQ